MYCLGLLQVDAPTERHIVLTRVFDAPRSAIFEALTTPELLRRWVGPRAFALDVCELEMVVGGRYRFRARGPCGTTICWHGAYLDIAPDERIVQTESYDDWEAQDSVVTTTFAAQRGTTRVTRTVRYASRQLRDAVLNCGIARGLAEGYDKLAELMCARVVA
jgi:uncharacterized protein YndB with AHSA1/START domain